MSFFIIIPISAKHAAQDMKRNDCVIHNRDCDENDSKGGSILEAGDPIDDSGFIKGVIVP